MPGQKLTAEQKVLKEKLRAEQAKNAVTMPKLSDIKRDEEILRSLGKDFNPRLTNQLTGDTRSR